MLPEQLEEKTACPLSSSMIDCWSEGKKQSQFENSELNGKKEHSKPIFSMSLLWNPEYYGHVDGNKCSYLDTKTWFIEPELC